MANKRKTGSIYYDKKDNKWKCSYYILNPETKQENRKYKSFYTEGEAKDFLTNIECQRGNELFIKNNGIPLNQLMRVSAKRKLDTNLIGERQYARILKTIQTIEKYPNMCKNIDDISSDEIQDYFNTLTNYSNSTIQKIYEQFSQSYRFALNKGYLSKNPLYDVIKPKSKKETKIVRALEIDEQQKLTDYLMSVPIELAPYKNVLLIQMYLGLRVGEALALKSSDIDLKNNLVKVDKTLTVDKDYNVIMGKTTKTQSGIREIPIPYFIRDSIIEQMKLAKNHKENLLFVSSDNDYVRHTNVNRYLKSIASKLGIEEISTHNLRHTYGTRCIEAGMRAVALQRLMGHKDINVTLNTYTSIFNKYKETEIEKVNDYYMNNEIITSFNTNNNIPKLDDDYER